ncbi:hypothetical protein P153DRAFT_313993 [Dothidotthia symphoricarpi CBS 119687]|uniref:C3H1-type domain-containing protein n=1 Tax=Dothidotthia symphoricarpi CBS 119687 TaxID=1392245 RepID=A0A6A6AHC2_9PLEO|nr:uncharacterized protein P153DRAFT_313993 [Dothidotthia symphoricarpi CBS 119687]KAF2130287.1 hypothetical protein P153DRAFT_313993 [Dothidotthia symphoricarpi CBS 119687]
MGEPENVAGLRAQLDALKFQGASAMREFETVTAKYGKVLGQSTESYEQLLAKYAALQQSYEQVKVAAEGDGSADPYVIVLIDAHSHKFRGDLVRGMNNGGSQAAKLLTEAVRQYLPKTKKYRLVVRVYANMKGLSQEAFKAGVLQNNQGGRSLSAFAVGFSREDTLFDFTDVGDQAIVEAKIVEMFKLHVKSPQCKAVLLGACCSSGYMRVLEAYSLFYEKVSLIQGKSLDPGIMQLPLKKVAFSQVFCSANPNGAPVELPAEVPTNILKTEICWAFQKEGCFRHNCKFKHVEIGPNPQAPAFVPTNAPPSPIPKRIRTPKPPAVSAEARSRNTRSPLQKSIFATHLPRQGITGKIPINAAAERLDLYMKAPTSAQWAAYEERMYTKKPCNAYHLHDACDRNPCPDDHAPVSPDVYYCLQYVLRGFPCEKGGRCRLLLCYSGHVCQSDECVPMKHDECTMPASMHDMDLTLVDWVQPEMPKIDWAEESEQAAAMNGRWESHDAPLIDLLA